MSVIEQLGEPKTVWARFLEVCNIPHPSYHTEKIGEYIRDFGAQKGYFSEIDAAGNVRIVVEGNEPGLPCIVLQSHIDMVPNSVDPAFDFTTTPITPIIDGENLTADGTTLGADNGVGLASMLAMLDHLPEKHGKLLLIFTNDEEVGLDGATALCPSWVEDGDYVLNLDEEDGAICLGCAGGCTTVTEFEIKPEENTEPVYQITFRGGLEGHSGADIHFPRHNINKVWARVFEGVEFRLCNVAVGNAHNIIPGVGNWWIATSMEPRALAEHIATRLEEIAAEIPEDCNLFFDLEEVENMPCWSLEAHNQFVSYMKNVPHGVRSYVEILGINTVETSLNVGGVISVENGKVKILTSCRSMNEEQLTDLINEVVEITGGVAVGTGRYPGWAPEPQSKLVKYACEVFEELNMKPHTYAIHAGLECGFLISKNPKMEGIAIGPKIMNPHTPHEFVNIESVRVYWEVLAKTILKLNQK
eukprot:TRINITY_DN2176_c0_g1_i1.p1 TRINITY_DN2176_c0_g1~~TRINITY_DN2176_c0_g1_i1.p1  ORF type:complete len:483 (+),score=165.50 TRINITY_DN2176_c0_g1_i1:32-1450(+)